MEKHQILIAVLGGLAILGIVFMIRGYIVRSFARVFSGLTFTMIDFASIAFAYNLFPIAIILSIASAILIFFWCTCSDFIIMKPTSTRTPTEE